MPYRPLGNNEARIFLRIMGVVGFASAFVVLWQQPGRPTGRWSWLIGPLFDIAGNFGVALFYVFLGFILLIIGFRTKAA